MERIPPMPLQPKVELKAVMKCAKCNSTDMLPVNRIELIEITDPNQIGKKLKNVNMNLVHMKCSGCGTCYSVKAWVDEIEKEEKKVKLEIVR